MPAGVGYNVLPAYVFETFVSVSRLDPPLKILLWRQRKERKAPVPPPAAEGPANAHQFQQNRNHGLAKIPRAPIVSDGLFEVCHFLKIVFVMLRVGSAVPVLGVAMVTNCQFGEFEEVPVEAISPK